MIPIIYLALLKFSNLGFLKKLDALREVQNDRKSHIMVGKWWFEGAPTFHYRVIQVFSRSACYFYNLQAKCVSGPVKVLATIETRQNVRNGHIYISVMKEHIMLYCAYFLRYWPKSFFPSVNQA